MTPTTLLFALLLSQPLIANPLFKANSFQANYSSVISAASGDINNDGFNDVVIATVQKGNVLLYLNDQNNGFEAQPFNLRRAVAQIELADMNGDGQVDLLVYSTEGDDGDGQPCILRPCESSSHFSYLEVFLSEGTGSFNMIQPNITFGTNGKSFAFRVADFNQDGYPDIIKTVETSNLVTNQSSYSSEVYMGGEGFSFQPVNTDINLERGSKLADYNQDGYLDIWNLLNAAKVHVYDVDQGFLAEHSVSLNIQPAEPQDPNTISGFSPSLYKVSLGDLDGDGDIDIQVFEHNGLFSRYLKTGNTFIPTGLNTELPLPFARLDQYHASVQYGGLIDLNNDGKLTTWMGANESENILLIGDSEVHAEPLVSVISSQPSNKFGRRALIDDFNADGRTDVVSIGANGLLMWENQAGQGLVSYQTKDGRWGINSIIKAADLDGDSRTDMVLAGKDGIALRKGNGVGAFAVAEQLSELPVSEVLLVDLDTDGQVEILAVSVDKIYQWQLNQQQAYVKTEIYVEPTGLLQTLQQHDLNGDGLTDLALINADEKLVILENTGNQLQVNFTFAAPVIDYAIVQQDQFDELLILSQEIFDTYQPGILVVNHDPVQGYETAAVIAAANLPVALGPEPFNRVKRGMQRVDFDADGDLDVALPQLNGIDDGLVWLSNEGSQWQGRLLDQGDSDLLPFAKEFADFNGDGYIDVFGSKLVFNIGFGHLDVDQISLGSASGLQAAQVLSMDLKTTDSELADIDGDGDLDLLHIGYAGMVATQLNTTQDVDFTGLWFNPVESGHGLQLEQIDLNGSLAVNFSWFAYHEGQPFWLIGVAPLDGDSVRVPVAYTDGAGFGEDFNSVDVNVHPWGHVDLSLTDNQLAISWETNQPGFSDGNMTMQRLAGVKPPSQQIDVINSCHSGSWFNPDQSGHGLFVDVIEQAEEVQMTLAWYHYLEGKQNWLVAQGPVFGNLAFLTAQAGSGGNFPPDFDDSAVSISEWGHLSFTVLPGSKAKLTWSGAASGFPPGELLLEKLTALDRYQCQQ